MHERTINKVMYSHFEKSLTNYAYLFSKVDKKFEYNCTNLSPFWRVGVFTKISNLSVNWCQSLQVTGRKKIRTGFLLWKKHTLYDIFFGKYLLLYNSSSCAHSAANSLSATFWFWLKYVLTSFGATDTAIFNNND